jgi:hypothetical protein
MPQVQRKHDFINVDCKRLKATLEDFLISLEDFQTHVKDLERENIKLKDMVVRFNKLVLAQAPKKVCEMWLLIKERQDILHLLSE